MARYILTKPASNDLREIVNYMREGSPRAAKHVRSELRAAMGKLASFPHMGHFREDITDEPLRFWSVYSYLIAYRPETKPLEIIRIVHGARELKHFFDRK